MNLDEALAVYAYQAAEIERLTAEVQSKNDQIGKIYTICNEKAVIQNANDHLRAALKGIAEYCSGDDRTLGALQRLAAIRNTAEQAIRTDEQGERT